MLRVLVLVLVLLTSHALWSLQLERRLQRCGDNRGRVGRTPPQGSRADSVVNRRLKTLFEICARPRPAPIHRATRSEVTWPRGNVRRATAARVTAVRSRTHLNTVGSWVPGTGYRISPPHVAETARRALMYRTFIHHRGLLHRAFAAWLHAPPSASQSARARAPS